MTRRFATTWSGVVRVPSRSVPERVPSTGCVAVSVPSHVRLAMRVAPLLVWFVRGLVLVTAAAAWLVPAALSHAAEVALTETDRAPPAFSLMALDGTTIDNDALAGKPWVINFWATWCPPCIEEMPAMNTAREALEPIGIGMLAINVGETPETIEAFLERVPIDFPILLGDGATTLPDWRARALPTTLVIDAEGRVVFEALGPRDWDDPGLIARIAALAGD